MHEIVRAFYVKYDQNYGLCTALGPLRLLQFLQFYTPLRSSIPLQLSIPPPPHDPLSPLWPSVSSLAPISSIVICPFSGPLPPLRPSAPFTVFYHSMAFYSLYRICFSHCFAVSHENMFRQNGPFCKTVKQAKGHCLLSEIAKRVSQIIKNLRGVPRTREGGQHCRCKAREGFPCELAGKSKGKTR
jgi:hypothetical protein